MSTRPIRMTLLAVLVAVVAGLTVGGLSQMTAVSVEDPRPSVPPPATPTLEPSPMATVSPSPSPTATPESGRDLWLYTITEGDSLSGIAIRFGTTTEELLTLNPEYENNENLVEAGARVIMPCTPIAAAEDRC